MKKRLLALALALLCILLLTAPVVALSLHADAADTVGKLHCHEKLVAFHDTDTGKIGFICAECFFTQTFDSTKHAVSVLSPYSIVQTSASIRSSCAHVYADNWVTHSEIQHKRLCTLCTHVDFDDHLMVPANCTVGEHCALCPAAYSSWQSKLGHELQLQFDYDRWVASGGLVDDAAADYYHGHYCTRTAELGGSLCNYVEHYYPCQMYQQWDPWDPAAGPIHEVWDQCGTCYMVGEMWTEECDALGRPGYSCHYCDRDPIDLSSKLKK